MFEIYFDGVIEQVYNRVSDVEKNVVMASYNNYFSMEKLESIKRYSLNKGNVFFAWKEYTNEPIVGAYDPFLDIICEIYRECVHGDFNQFLTECKVYELHRGVLNSYYESGICRRQETILLDEVAYEQYHMKKTILLMLKKIAEYKPIVIVINNFQMASQSTLELINELIEHPVNRIGVVLGVNEGRIQRENNYEAWNKLYELVGDLGQIYHLGSSGRKTNISYTESFVSNQNHEKIFTQLNNVMELLDFRQAQSFFVNVERQIKFEEIKVPQNIMLSMYFMYTRVAIALGDISKAWDIIEEITKIDRVEREDIISYQCSMDIATCYMYQGKLEQAYQYAQRAKEKAEKIGNEEMTFKAEVLMVRTKMSGWHNFLFCTDDVDVDNALIEKLCHYNYKNHLAHIYIYAFDNRPEVIAKAYRSESALAFFSKGVKLAKEIGNELLVCAAYQKNIMIASTNGMNEIALLYAIRTYQYVKVRISPEAGRMLSAIGYNLSALGQLECAMHFYEYAINIFYKLQLPEEIAEVYYNYSLTNIALGQYKKAEECLKFTLKIVNRLSLNSLRVCNLSKLYALYALLSDLQGNRFDCERNLQSCEYFLNFVLDKKESSMHDYSNKDDDICLYFLAKGLHQIGLDRYEEAFDDLEKAEIHFRKAEGNLFYVHSLYRKCRMDLYEKMGRNALYEIEKDALLEHEVMMQQLKIEVSLAFVEEIKKENKELQPVTPEQIEEIIKQEVWIRESRRSKRQLDFISVWQNLLDKTNVRVLEMTKSAISLFLNYFNNDCAMYVRYDGGSPHVLYNNTGVFFTDEKIWKLEKYLHEYPKGIAVSKISRTFLENRELIDWFGIDAVCSFVAIPFYKDGKLESFLITYIKMKDNWHDTESRYLLNEEDLKIYQLLFRELGYAISRLESYEKIYLMNKRLQEAATTDVLTNVTNRMGMYEKIGHFLKEPENQGIGVMFIDLDNFKPYNDTYGHEIGDIVLQEMARIFEAVVEQSGFVVRYGGDEFVIITYIYQKEELEKIAEKIYNELEKANGFISKIQDVLQREICIDAEHKIGCSIGITSCEKLRDINELDMLIKAADESLYNVKATRKGTYIFA